MITLNQIRAKLQETIKQGGLTQTELACRIGIKQQQISSYLKGDKMPALDTFANLCAVLDVNPADILCVADYKAP